MRITPFRGYRFAGSDPLSTVVAPPYDQIDGGTQERLEAMSASNIVRVTLPRGNGDRYANAARVLDGWLADGVWARDPAPAIYPYHQTYTAGGRSITRMGFVALGEVTDYAKGVVLPHERTHAGPKQDRLHLLEATRADIGLIFMLVSDPAGDLRPVVAPAGPPLCEARDLRGEVHRLWRVTEPDLLARVQAVMAPRTVIIADGHHRYETAVEYARAHGTARDKLMAFFALEAPGLTILPNHRLVHGVGDFSLDRLLAAARPWFDARPLSDPRGFRPDSHRLGVVTARRAFALELREDAFDRIDWPLARSRAWRDLAVSILHEGLLRPLLGITDADLDARTRVDYTADQDEAVRLAEEGKYQAAFLIASCTPDELAAVMRGGELMPQKSTHFYPKLLDGLVFHRLDIP